MQFYLVLRQILHTLITAFITLLFVRAIMSWLPNLSSSSFAALLDRITEPIISPVRALVYKLFPGLRNFPIDLSTLIVFIALSAILRLL